MSEVICCKANRFKACNDCIHSIPHERDDDPVHGGYTKCTMWGECYPYGNEAVEKVRCISCKGGEG
jgi:hypothetical protein